MQHWNKKMNNCPNATRPIKAVVKKTGLLDKVKSKINLDVDYKGTPRVTIVKDFEGSFPEDVRDKLVSIFFEQFGSASNYLRAEFSEIDGKTVMFIDAVKQSEMGNLLSEIEERVKFLDTGLK